MGDLGDKAQEFGGKAKEGIGEAVGNDDLANEGRADQVKAEIKDKLDAAGDAVQGDPAQVLGHLQKRAQIGVCGARFRFLTV